MPWNNTDIPEILTEREIVFQVWDDLEDDISNHFYSIVL